MHFSYVKTEIYWITKSKSASYSLTKTIGHMPPQFSKTRDKNPLIHTFPWFNNTIGDGSQDAIQPNVGKDGPGGGDDKDTQVSKSFKESWIIIYF